MISFKKFKNTLVKLKDLQRESDAFLDALPHEVRDAFFDNPHSNAQGKAHDFLVDQLFGKMADEASFFLYEWQAGHENIWNDGSSYDISTPARYFDYIEMVYYNDNIVSIDIGKHGAGR
jgi:hypothetical protein